MATPTTLPPSDTNSTLSAIEVRIKDDNKAFFLANLGFTRRQLHGHRIRAAYTAIKAFVSARQERDIPDFEKRLLIYTRLLLREMVVYETTREASGMNVNGSYRRLKIRVRAAWKIEEGRRAEAVRQIIADFPAEYEVEEEPWPVHHPHGAVLWWVIIERNTDMTLENIVKFESEDDDVPLADVEELSRDLSSIHPASTEAPRDESSSGRQLPSPLCPSPVHAPSAPSPHSREQNSEPPPAQRAGPSNDASNSEGPTTRNLRSRSGRSQVKTTPAPDPRSHSRGKGGKQPPAERAMLGEGAATHKAALSDPKKEVGSEDNAAATDDLDELPDDAESSGEGQAVPGADLTRDPVPEDVMVLFESLRKASKKAFNWRAPHGLTPKIPAKGWKTIEDIRAAHTDADGNITSYADLTELFELREWHGLHGVDTEFEVPCKTCLAAGLACHYWNRKSCTNCYATRGRCEDGVLNPAAHANSQMMKGRHKGIFEPRPELRFYALKQLEDVMGGWDHRLNAVGEPNKSAKEDAPVAKANRRAPSTRAGLDGEANPPTEPDTNMDIDSPVTQSASAEHEGGTSGVALTEPEPEPAAEPALADKSDATPMVWDDDATAPTDCGPSPSLAATIVTADAAFVPSGAVDGVDSISGEGAVNYHDLASVPLPVSGGATSPGSHGPRRIAHMEPLNQPPRSAVDRPRTAPLPANDRRVASPPANDRGGRVGADADQPDLNSAEWRSLPQRVALVERILGDDRKNFDSRLDLLDSQLSLITAGFVTMNTTMQSAHTMSAEAAECSRRTEQKINSWEPRPYTRPSGRQASGVSMPAAESLPHSSATVPPKEVPATQDPEAFMCKLIRDSVTQTEASVSKKLQGKVDHLEQEAARVLAQVKEQAERDSAKLVELADKRASEIQEARKLQEKTNQALADLEVRLKAAEERLNSGMAASSLSAATGAATAPHSVGGETSAPTAVGGNVDPRSATTGEVTAPPPVSCEKAAPTAVGGNADLHGETATAGADATKWAESSSGTSAEFTPAQRSSVEGRAEGTMRQEASGSVRSEVAAVESDEETSPPAASRKRRSADHPAPGADDSGEPASKRRRSSSPLDPPR